MKNILPIAILLMCSPVMAGPFGNVVRSRPVQFRVFSEKKAVAQPVRQLTRPALQLIQRNQCRMINGVMVCPARGR